jgi:hypothetical protein
LLSKLEHTVAFPASLTLKNLVALSERFALGILPRRKSYHAVPSVSLTYCDVYSTYAANVILCWVFYISC